MKTTQISRTDDTQYGLASNGHNCGSGYDVEIKRYDDTAALVCVTKVSTREEWMAEIAVEADTNLQQRAIIIAGSPHAELGEWPTEEDWDALVDNWNNITVE